MRHSVTSHRFMVFGVLVLLIFAPIIVLISLSPKFSTYIPMVGSLKKQPVNVKFSAKSNIPEYRLKLADSQFLEFVTSDMHLFDSNAVVDPLSIRKQDENPSRFTVSSVVFELVDSVTNPLGIILKGGNGNDKHAIIGEGTYSVEGDALIVRIAIHFDKLDSLMEKYTFERTILRTALNTISYATGQLGALNQQKTILKLNEQTNKYIQTGLFPWPFSVEKQ